MTDQTPHEPNALDDLTPAEEAALTPEQRFTRAIAALRILAGRLGVIRTVLRYVIGSIVFDVALSVWALFLTFSQADSASHQKALDDCRNDRSAHFFAAEKAKVEGQIDGWRIQIEGLRAQSAALAQLGMSKDQAASRRAYAAYQRGGETSIAGLQRAIDQSQHYLDSIANRGGDC